MASASLCTEELFITKSSSAGTSKSDGLLAAELTVMRVAFNGPTPLALCPGCWRNSAAGGGERYNSCICGMSESSGYRYSTVWLGFLLAAPVGQASLEYSLSSERSWPEEVISKRYKLSARSKDMAPNSCVQNRAGGRVSNVSVSTGGRGRRR